MIVNNDPDLGSSRWNGPAVKIPRANDGEVSAVFTLYSEARTTARRAQRGFLNQLGYLFWLTTSSDGWNVRLPEEVLNFVVELRLSEREKRGCLLVLHRDYKILNLAHMIRFTIPFHYAWTDKDSQEHRLFQFSPTLLREYIRLCQQREGAPVPLEELPHYVKWETRYELKRYDSMLQDRLMRNNRSWCRPRFEQDYHYLVVPCDFWGGRVLTDVLEIRAYAEQFMSTVSHQGNQSYITFFMQYPIRDIIQYHPPERRLPLRCDPGSSEPLGYGLPLIAPIERTYDRPALLRGSWKPEERRGRFSRSYECRISLHERLSSPGHRQMREESPAPRANARPSVTDRGHATPSGRRRASRSLSPPCRRAQENTAESYEPRTKLDFLNAIRDCGGIVTEIDPHYDVPIIPEWNPLALEKGILVFEDPRAEIRMRCWAANWEETESMAQLLTMAVRFGIKFNIAYRLDDVPLFKRPGQYTKPSYLELGFRETALEWSGGAVAMRSLYKDQAQNVGRRDHAGAIIAAGGFPVRILLWLVPHAMTNLARGPSTRVSEFLCGRTFRSVVMSSKDFSQEDVVLTCDQYSAGEIDVLNGFIDKKHPDQDLTIFPPQYILEEVLPGHFHGAMSAHAQDLFNYIVKDIEDDNKVRGSWRTVGGWRKFLRNSKRGTFAAKNFPTEDDFQRGASLFDGAFGKSWNCRPIREIVLPKEFRNELPGENPYDL
ncbi:hypothetical protein DFH07DRAFT_739161 [Mycena maculata]|uniref:Uncharacterized protein n=1 Tax=Mycena maculata TaxID=230809 RepID=A0AAD7NHW3_9AGAR|nr:hypothetical protein DFH07DRAFT_739161 [Mycena maculata]